MMKKEKIPLIISGNNTINDNLMHDAELVAFRFQNQDAKNDIHIELESGSKEKIELNLINVAQLFATSILPQNVVLDIAALKGDDALNRLEEYASSFFITSSGLSLLKTKIKDNELIVVHVIPSLGFEAVIICKNIEIFKLS